MTDTGIPSLIERAHKHADVHDAWDKFELGMEVPPPLHRGATAVCLREMADALSRLTVEPPAINIAHIKAFATCMTRDNWADMQDHILRQVEELSRLSASPLPGEIASAIAGLAVIRDSTVRPELRDYTRTAIAALQQMAREIKSWGLTAERLKAELALLEGRCREQAREIEKLTKLADSYRDLAGEQQTKWATRCVTAEARIRELESEVQRDHEAHEQQEARHLENVAQWRERIRELEAERDKLAEANMDAEMAHGALNAIHELLDSGGIPRGTFADDHVRNLVAMFNNLKAERAQQARTINEWAEAIRGLAQPPEAGKGEKP